MESVLVEHFFLGCLAHASYLVGSEGVAAVIDPQRDVNIYLDDRASISAKTPARPHVPGSVHIALSGQYASWAARILGLDKRIILVGEDADHLRESQLRLARVGIENVHAYLEDGITGWIKGGYELDYIPQISVQEFVELLEQEKHRIGVLDVRERGEVETGAMERRAGFRDIANLTGGFDGWNALGHSG